MKLRDGKKYSTKNDDNLLHYSLDTVLFGSRKQNSSPKRHHRSSLPPMISNRMRLMAASAQLTDDVKNGSDDVVSQNLKSLPTSESGRKMQTIAARVQTMGSQELISKRVSSIKSSVQYQNKRLLIAAAAGEHENCVLTSTPINANESKTSSKKTYFAETEFISSACTARKNISRMQKKGLKQDMKSFVMNDTYSYYTNNSSGKPSLEDLVFHDISCSEPGKLYDDNVSITTNHSFHKLNGSFIWSSDDEDVTELDTNIHHSLSHVNRSKYRQKRREWYLNRRTMRQMTLFQRVYQYIKILIIIPMIINITSKVLYKLLAMTYGFYKLVLIFVKRVHGYVINYFKTIIKLVNRKYENITILSSIVNGSGYKRSKLQDEDTVNDDQLLIPASYCCWNYVYALILLLFFVPLIFLLTGISSRGYTTLVPDPKLNGLKNALILNIDDKKIPSWHVLPPSSQMYSANNYFDDKSPVILLVHNHGFVITKHRIAVLKSLSSPGYHVIVPINILSQEEIFNVWSWIKKKAINSEAYIWGDHIDASTLIGYAKKFCDQLVPPFGVVIEVSANNLLKKQRSLEIWSCNCTSVKSPRNDDIYHKYNHVSCPVRLGVEENVYNQVVTCIEAVHKEMK